MSNPTTPSVVHPLEATPEAGLEVVQSQHDVPHPDAVQVATNATRPAIHPPDVPDQDQTPESTVDTSDPILVPNLAQDQDRP